MVPERARRPHVHPRPAGGGAAPADIHRGRRQAIAIDQTETAEWARDRVWDCRPQCCILSDSHAAPDTHLDLGYLESRLRHYPDQCLAANILEGIRLVADAELQSVWVPHLTSLPSGHASVGEAFRRLRSLGWYEFYSNLPFWPMYLSGQGATARKLEPDRFRRATEGNGPRAPTFDASGLQAISINEASHICLMPQRFLRDERPDFRDWPHARGLPAPSPPPASATSRFTRWPKERKPQLAAVMRDIAGFNRAGHLLGEPTYGFEDDAKDYFNQLVVAPSELHRVGTIFLAASDDLAHPRDPPPGTAASTERLPGVNQLIFNPTIWPAHATRRPAPLLPPSGSLGQTSSSLSLKSGSASAPTALPTSPSVLATPSWSGIAQIWTLQTPKPGPVQVLVSSPGSSCVSMFRGAGGNPASPSIAGR